MNPLTWPQMVLPVVVCAMVAAVAVRVPRYRFALYGLFAVVGYAILQDQVSARLCPEYFTVLHPPIPNLTDPTLLGVCWGFLGGWWGGIVLGYAAGLVCTLGPRPPLHPRDFVKPLAACMVAVGTVTALCGYSVWRHADMLNVSLVGMDGVIPPERHRAALTVASYHFVSYAASALGGVAVCAWLAAERRRRGG